MGITPTTGAESFLSTSNPSVRQAQPSNSEQKGDSERGKATNQPEG
jgi:hypothetical protein